MSSSKLDIKQLYEEYKNNILSYLFLLQSEFSEINILINELKYYKPFHLDIGEATPTQNALNIAVVISYARNFKRSFGFNNYKEINDFLIRNYSEEQNKLHKRILKERDKEFAHSDASANDIQLYGEENIFSFSRKRVRQLLDKQELNILQDMVSGIRDEIEAQINILK